jgi:hypothetical protein
VSNALQNGHIPSKKLLLAIEISHQYFFLLQFIAFSSDANNPLEFAGVASIQIE